MAKGVITVVELFCDMHIAAQKTTTTRFDLTHKSTFPQEGLCLSADEVRDSDGSNQLGLQRKFNGTTFLDQKPTKHHKLVSFGLWAFSLEWLALIVSFAYPTVSFFLAGGAACSLALALNDREMGGCYATMK